MSMSKPGRGPRERRETLEVTQFMLLSLDSPLLHVF